MENRKWDYRKEVHKIVKHKVAFIGFKYSLNFSGIFHEKILIREEKNIVSLGSSRKTNLFPAENLKKFIIGAELYIEEPNPYER